jgi:transcriptional regulator with XRE-family HTH domain
MSQVVYQPGITCNLGMRHATLESMAHPPDRALSRAITEILREARQRGMNQKDLADYFGVSDATISRWEAGGRQPALDKLPEFDRLAGRERGYVLRRAGYVTDNNTSSTARTRTRYDVDFDNPDERDLWRLDHIPEAKRWKLILGLREIEAEPPPPSRRQPKPTKGRARKAG